MITHNKGLIKSETSTIGQILNSQTDDILLIDCSYQRAYEWGETEIENLIDSILDISNNNYLFLNTIYRCVDENNTNNYHLIDGQQRILTIFLLLKFLTMKNINCQFISKNYANEYILNFINNVKRRNEFEKMCSIIDNSTYQSFNDDFIDKKEDIDDNKLNEFEKILISINKYFSNSDINNIPDLVRKIQSRVFILVIQVPIINAADLYKDINSKGLKLDIIDRYKPDFIKNLSHKEIEDFSAKWEIIMNNINIAVSKGFKSKSKDETVKELFFKWLFQIKANELEKNENNLESIVSKFIKNINKKILFEFLDQGIHYSDELNDILANKNRKYIMLNSLSGGGYSYYPLLMIGRRLFENDIFDKFIVMLNNFFISYMLLNGGIGNKDFSGKISHILSLLTNKNTTFNDLEKYYNDFIINNIEQMKSNFNDLNYKKNKKLIYNILIYIEAHLQYKVDNKYIFDELENLLLNKDKTDKATIEHISSQDNKYDWIHNIGNLTLLTLRENTAVKNNSKYNCYNKAYHMITYEFINPDRHTKTIGNKLRNIQDDNYVIDESQLENYNEYNSNIRSNIMKRRLFEILLDENRLKMT